MSTLPAPRNPYTGTSVSPQSRRMRDSATRGQQMRDSATRRPQPIAGSPNPLLRPQQRVISRSVSPAPVQQAPRVITGSLLQQRIVTQEQPRQTVVSRRVVSQPQPIQTTVSTRVVQQPIVRQVTPVRRVIPNVQVVVPNSPPQRAVLQTRIVAPPSPARSIVVQRPREEPVQQANPNKSIMVVDDEERYRRVASGMNGYGRNKGGAWRKNLNHSYMKRHDKDLKPAIIDQKENADEYRYDPWCNLI